jgi:quercetin dioxygenase-like cupin family protein
MVNADLSQRCVVDGNTLAWQPSPSPLVHRRLLERNGGEVARATSIVRYDAGAKFDLHAHALGEEILVLDGTLSDEFGDYGPGTYLKNPSGSSHAPFSEGGCTLFVKLRHLSADDSERVVVRTHQSPWYRGMVEGLTVMPLSEFGTSHTAMVRWAPGTYFNPHRHSLQRLLGREGDLLTKLPAIGRLCNPSPALHIGPQVQKTTIRLF